MENTRKSNISVSIKVFNTQKENRNKRYFNVAHYFPCQGKVQSLFVSSPGVFTAPIRGVYYIRFTANGPTNFPKSAVLYKNDNEIQLIAHEQTSGEGSDTASNGAALLLEKGDRLKMVLWHNTQIWDNSNHHSTFSGFLLFPM